MKKKILVSAMLMTMASAASTTASAALTSGAVLNFDSGVASAYGKVLSGSYFGMDTNGDGVVKAAERTALVQNDGIILGTIQTASGSHTGAPGCVNDEAAAAAAGVDPTCTNTGENPGLDSPWNFFGNTGMHQTLAASNILSAAGNTATVDFSGWTVAWNGNNIDMSSGAWQGNADGVAEITCGTDCAVGDTYTLTYSATVPASDPGFGGVKYNLNLVGTIGAGAPIPVPAAVWLFGSGLIGLAGIARRRKSA